MVTTNLSVWVCLTIANSFIGAILFQGFKIKEASDFQQVIQQYDPDLCNTYRGTSPRNLIQGTKVLINYIM